MAAAFPWWYPVGGQLQESGAAFRVWTHRHETVSVVLNKKEHPLNLEEGGYFEGFVEGAREGDRYTYLVDGKGPFSDPASRFQPEGPDGPSQLVNPDRFAWHDSAWSGLKLAGQVIYELHVGTFTRAGTFHSAMEQLSELAVLGITAIEVMPVSEFAGSYGWGYDGVDLFAPTRNYGVPDDFRAFVDAAHSHGIGVILDVVYNHIGPKGNYLPMFSADYFTDQYKTDWGAAINFHGKNCQPVRQFFASNAAYWIKEYHLDGLRLDATQNIYDLPDNHILAEIVRRSRKAGESRSVLIVAENEPQETKLIRPEEEGGYGLDGMWNDDFHHSAIVASTGNREAYFWDYLGTPQELLSAMKYGYLYQGQWYQWQKQRRGKPTFGTDPAAMITFLQNHDQIANSGRGFRLHRLTSFGNLKAMTALCLLGTGTPMLFQGQEFASSAPFLFFADHPPELAEKVRQGRKEFLSQWRSLATCELKLADPCDKATFEQCRLDFSERERHREIYALHRDLLQLRKSEPLFSRQSRQLDGAVLGSQSFVVRFFSDDYRDDRLLVVNLGTQLDFNPSPVPLLAPPEEMEWSILWSSEDPRYRGNGTPALDSEMNWIVPAHAAVVLKPKPIQQKGSVKS